MAFGEHAAGVEILPALARTANATSGGVDTAAKNNPQGAVALLSVGAASGTAPTLDVRLQHADNDVAAEYTDVPNGAFGQRTGAGFQERDIKNFKRFVRAVGVVGGGTPSFTYSVTVVLGDAMRVPV